MLSNNKEVKYLHLNMKPHEGMAVSASGHGEGCAGDLRAMSTVPIMNSGFWNGDQLLVKFSTEIQNRRQLSPQLSWEFHS